MMKPWPRPCSRGNAHNEAVHRLAQSVKRRVSFVDQVSFLVMRSRGVETTLAFDSDFEEEGFRLYSA